MRPHRDNSLRLRTFARQLRKSSTDAERKLWSILRSRQLAGFKFRRQYPIAGYIVDFYCVSGRLAIELDGGQHSEPFAKAYDRARTQALSAMGVRMVRYWDHDLLRTPDVIEEDIYRHLTSELPSRQPSPGVPGDG